MKIINLYAENIKRIKVIDITPKDNTIIIEGPNEAGKTSALDSIAWALGGKSLIPKNPIRKGEETATVRINIDEYMITRTWTSKGTYLTVVNKYNMTAGNPQKFLDDMIGNLSFDPLKFGTMDKKKRLEILKTIANLDFTEINEQIKEAEEHRYEENRDVDKLKKELERFADIKDVGKVRPISEIMANLEHSKMTNKNITDAKTIINNNLIFIKEKKEEIKELQADIEKMEKQNIEMQEQAKAEEIDIAPIEKELKQAEENQKLQFRINRKNELEEMIPEQERTKKLADGKVKELRKQKEDMVKQAKMPIEGLELGEDDVLYKGVEYSEISQAQQIQVSMSIAMAENPKLKIVRIMDGSLLDKNSFKKIKDIAKEKDFQVWIERVADDPSGEANVLFIEEGEIKK